MNKKELYDWIDSLSQDIEFEYNGKSGSICPFSRDNIALAYGTESASASSLEDAMSLPFIDGLSLSEVCENVDFW